LPGNQQPVQLAAFLFLEKPGVRDGNAAIKEHRDRTGKERALNP
jgi:hypothetical protein